MRMVSSIPVLTCFAKIHFSSRRLVVSCKFRLTFSSLRLASETSRHPLIVTAQRMRNLLFSLSLLVYGIFVGRVAGQTLTFDASIAGYQVAWATNSIAVAGEVDAFSFDALAGDIVS